MTDPRPKPNVASTAKVLSAFMKAFSKTLMSGRSTAKSITAQLQDTPEGVSRLWARSAKLIMEEGIALLIDQLQAENRLTSTEVRFLDEDGVLRVDRLYRTPDDGAPAAGLHLAHAERLEVRDPAAEGATVRISLDPERRAIAAYPGRVFVSDGQRFRIREDRGDEDASR